MLPLMLPQTPSAYQNLWYDIPGRSGLKASTITRRCAGIRYMHRMAGFESATTSEAIKAVLAGIRRSIGTSVTRKVPATAEAIRAIIADMPPSLRGLRDRALLELCR